MRCRYCEKICKNINSLKQHELRCPKNENREYKWGKINYTLKRCKYCGENKRSSVLKAHENSCLLNPINKKYCKNCGNIILKNNKFCCMSCSASYNNSRRKFSQKNKDKKLHKYCVDCGKEISLYASRCKECCVIKRKGCKISNEQKEFLSKIRSKTIEEKGVGGFLDTKYYKIKNINNIEYSVRGTWELRYAKFLNSSNILWERKYYLYYTTYDGVKRTYCPDFHLPISNEIVEVKGYFSDEDKQKIKLVEEQNNIKIKVLLEKDLKELGIFKLPI
jgi:hypothetical protein